MNAPTSLAPAAQAPITTVSSNPAENLVGLLIVDGWQAVTKIDKPDQGANSDLSGGFFSVGYICEKDIEENKRKKKVKAFLKVIDVQKAIMLYGHLPLMERLRLMSSSFSFECDILELCRNAKLDRIVKVISKGDLPPPDGSMFELPYILFEIADGDVRKIVSRSDKIDDAWRFRVLHDVAVGIQQLHSKDIAHQDLKPSNVLIFDEKKEGAKIGDLGCSTSLARSGVRDGEMIPGDKFYAPPEQAFGIRPEEWIDRCQAADLYHLGTLAAFLFAGLVPINFYLEKLPVEARPPLWGGKGRCDYRTALPALQATFSEYVETIQNDFPAWARHRLSELIVHACNPDYSSRGDPSSRRRTGRPIGIETFVSRFNRLAKDAEIEFMKEVEGSAPEAL